MKTLCVVLSVWTLPWVLLSDRPDDSTLRRQPAVAFAYRIEPAPRTSASLRHKYSAAQLDILEKLNRADRAHLGRLRELVVPERWLPDELAYSAMPTYYAAAAGDRKVLVLHLPGQIFGAYEFGTLVRWGPVSSGRRASQTPAGFFSLTWKSYGHASSVDPDWFMRWYFNFETEAGLALHAYAMPGRPASHGCVRLLERDARWLFDWGDEWLLDASGTEVRKPGTPVLIVGAYDFDAPPPWRSLEWLVRQVELPPLPPARTTT
jgi:hypothetical protein